MKNKRIWINFMWEFTKSNMLDGTTTGQVTKHYSLLYCSQTVVYKWVTSLFIKKKVEKCQVSDYFLASKTVAMMILDQSK